MADQNANTLENLEQMLCMDKDLIFRASRSVKSISKILYQDLMDQYHGCAELTQLDREGMLQALSLVGDQLGDHFEFLDNRKVG